MKVEQYMIMMARKSTHPGEILREDFMPTMGCRLRCLRSAWVCRGSR